MKYSYSIDYIELKNSKHFTFALPIEFQQVNRFLNSDVGDEYSANVYMKAIMSVMNGEIEEKTMSGNLCFIRIKHDFTDIQDLYFEQKSISIETSELILLIEAYLKEKKEFMEAQNSL